MPAISGWSSGMVPQPIRVGMTGTFSSSASSTSRSAASALMMPPPATITGRSRRGQHVHCLGRLGPGGLRLVDRQRLVGVGVELDLGHLHVERQVDQHRAGPAGAHQVERLLERAGHLGRLEHGHRHLRQRLGDGGDVDGLEVLLVQPGDGRLAGDAQDRDRVGRRRVQAGDHVGAGRAGGADAHADVAGPGPGVALGHVGGALDVPGQDVLDPAVVAHGGVERVDGGPGQPEDRVDAFLFQDGDGGVDGTHGGHGSVLSCRSRWVARVAGPGRTGAVPRAAARSGPGRRRRWPRAEPISWATTAPSGMTTPASRAAAVTMPRSLWCRSIRKPGSKSRSSMLPPFWSSTLLPARPPPSTLSAACGVHAVGLDERRRPRRAARCCRRRSAGWRPSRSARRRSARRARSSCRPRRRPRPAASKSAGSPPTMMDSAAFVAPASPPDTGASRSRKPRSVACFASSAVTSGRIEEKSMISVPGLALSNTPPVAGQHLAGRPGSRAP